MIQHLISATLIWALALLLYELIFRRLRHHGANRAYLLAGLAMGLLLPLFPLRVGHDAPAALQAPMVRYTGMRQAAAEQLAPVIDTSAPVVNWWLVLYAMGAVVAGGYLAYQAFTLLRIRQGAAVDSAHGRSFLRSSRVALPCSFFGWIILPEGADYTPGEQAMILRHEEEHRRLLHSVDVLALALLRVVLWFHPLVYLYDRRLRMVHEFQADAPHRSDALAYGRLLVEQAMAGHTPALTHAFFQSPLKTRIAMLLKTSTATRLRYLAAFLLLPVFFACGVHNDAGSKQTHNGKYFRFGDHTVKLGVTTDTIRQTNPATGLESAISPGDSIPVALDNEPVYQITSLTRQPVLQSKQPNLGATIFNHMQPLLNKLPDGNYGFFLTNAVLDKTGRIAYCEGGGISPSPVILFEENGEMVPGFMISDMDSSEMKEVMASAKRDNESNDSPATAHVPRSVAEPKKTIAPKLKEQLDAKLEEALEAVRYQPGELQGKAVASALYINELDLFLSYIIVVKDGKSTLTKAFATM